MSRWIVGRGVRLVSELKAWPTWSQFQIDCANLVHLKADWCGAEFSVEQGSESGPSSGSQGLLLAFGRDELQSLLLYLRTT